MAGVMTWYVRSGWSGQVYGPCDWDGAVGIARVFWRTTSIQPHISTQRERLRP